VNNYLSRLFPGGFYYKTFMWPRSFWESVYEPFIRNAAGLGDAARERDPDTYEQMHVHVDVLVVGGGVAGLAAAEAAAASGKRVILADENPVLGGVARHFRWHHRRQAARRMGCGRRSPVCEGWQRARADADHGGRSLPPQLPAGRRTGCRS
jgi:NADPH-dependent 2,4-dienoyl-CoA reductase/sulfur reductase-like enzyme